MQQTDIKQIRCIVYTRVSKDNKDTKGSHEDQTGALSNLEDAKKEETHINQKLGSDEQRIIIETVFEDKTAADKDDIFDAITYMKLRPKFYMIYEMALKREFDELWCWSWSRFSRSEFQPILIKMFEQCSVKIKTLTGSTDPLAVKVENLFNVKYIEDQKLASERTHQERIKKGLRLTKPCYGYETLGGGKLRQDINAEAIKKAGLLLLQGVSEKDVRASVKFKQKRGGQKGRSKLFCLSLTTFRGLMTNPVLCGYSRYRGSLYKLNIEGEPIFTKETFDQIQDKLKPVEPMSQSEKKLLELMKSLGKEQYVHTDFEGHIELHKKYVAKCLRKLAKRRLLIMKEEKRKQLFSLK